MNDSLSSLLTRVFPNGLRGLIFDCDGVLVDSCAANIGYYNRLLAEFGLPPVADDLVEYVQMSTAEQALRCLFTPEQYEQLPAIAQRIPYKTVTLPLLKLEPGLKEMLLWLHGRGVRLGVHTNRGNGMWDVLQKFGMENLFDPVMTVEVVEPKPSPEGVLRTLKAWKIPAETVGFVGDSATDAAAAGGGGVSLIAYRNADLPASVHVDDFPALHRALENLPGLGE